MKETNKSSQVPERDLRAVIQKVYLERPRKPGPFSLHGSTPWASDTGP